MIFCTHCWWIFLIWNSDWSWLIKCWSLTIKAQKQNPPKNSGHPGRRYWGEEKFPSICLPPSIRIFQAIWPSVLIDFHWFTYSDILKNALPIILKSVWWSFKNQKSEMYIFLVFPCWSSWHMRFLPYPSVSGGKLAQKMSRFWFLRKFKNLSNVLQKSIAFKNDFHFFGRVRIFLGPSRSFSTPNFLSGASQKGLNFMIAFDHNLIFEKNQKSLKTFCKNPLLLKMIFIFLAA